MAGRRDMEMILSGDGVREKVGLKTSIWHLNSSLSLIMAQGNRRILVSPTHTL